MLHCTGQEWTDTDTVSIANNARRSLDSSECQTLVPQTAQTAQIEVGD